MSVTSESDTQGWLLISSVCISCDVCSAVVTGIVSWQQGSGEVKVYFVQATKGELGS